MFYFVQDHKIHLETLQQKPVYPQLIVQQIIMLITSQEIVFYNVHKQNQYYMLKINQKDAYSNAQMIVMLILQQIFVLDNALVHQIYLVIIQQITVFNNVHSNQILFSLTMLLEHVNIIAQ